ncbi:MAG: hypothetical protein VXZ82_24935 [Planctomycetota bacterium]|nr:hypothetical protein [Planctomycetota bacterium]
MNRVLLGLALVVTISCSTGCEILNNKCRSCKTCASGCRPSTIGWQRGGTDYQRFLTKNCNRSCKTMPASGVGSPGAAQVAYPYYTTRGPRDFFVNNPPTIGN